jgi:hypothetical protein
MSLRILAVLSALLALPGMVWNHNWRSHGPETVRPADSIFVEAESLTGDSTAWKPGSFGPLTASGMYGYPSNRQWLGGPGNGNAGVATTTVTINKEGTYRIWVRCLDIPHAPFRVAVRQFDSTIVEGDFNHEHRPRRHDHPADVM